MIDVAIASIMDTRCLPGPSFFLLARGLEIQLSFAEAIALVAVANLATALPGAGGGIGTFEVMTAHAGAAMGIGDASASAYAVALHALNIVPITLLGIAFVVLSSGIRWEPSGEEVEEAASDGRLARGRGGTAVIAHRAA